MPFGTFFGVFWKYWDYTSKTETDYTAFEVLIMTSLLFEQLKNQWEKLKWDVEELK